MRSFESLISNARSRHRPALTDITFFVSGSLCKDESGFLECPLAQELKAPRIGEYGWPLNDEGGEVVPDYAENLYLECWQRGGRQHRAEGSRARRLLGFAVLLGM